MSNDPAVIERDVPLSAMRFSAHAFAVDDDESNQKFAPFRMTALSGEPIEHWYWGKIVQDLQGMKLSKPKLPVDYCHDPKEVMGYAKGFSTDDGRLDIVGALVPYKESDRATEVIAKSRAGVPYEASIDWTPSKDGDVAFVEYGEGSTAVVNGRAIPGPVTVLTSWTLRGVAVCPYGADRNTETTVFGKGENDKTVRVKIAQQTTKGTAEMNDKENAEAAEQARLAAEQDERAKAEAAAEAARQTAEQPTETQVMPDDGRAEFRRFVEAFGDQAQTLFCECKTFDEARERWMQGVVKERDALKAEVAELKAKLATQGAAPFKPTDTAQTAIVADERKARSEALWAEYRKIEGNAEKTKFYREHKAEMSA